MSSSRVLLWLPLPCVALTAWLVDRGLDGPAGLDPVSGWRLVLCWTGILLVGGVAAVLAVVGSFGPPAGRASAALVSAAVTALGGLWVVGTAAGQGRSEGIAVAAVLLPLAATVGARVVDLLRGAAAERRSRRETEGGA